MRIFLFIASGVFGRDALAGSPTFAFGGALFHYIIAFCWTLFYFAIYPKLRMLFTNPYVRGLGYGVFVWLGMNLVVVPLSSTPPLLFTVSRALVGLAMLMVCVGLPISISAHRRFSQNNQMPSSRNSS